MRALGIDKIFNDLTPALRVGKVVKIGSGYVVAKGPMATTGDICEVEARGLGADQNQRVLAQIASVQDDQVTLVPLQTIWMIEPDAKVVLLPFRTEAPVGDDFSGRAIDALGRAIDQSLEISVHTRMPLYGSVLAPMERIDPVVRLATGIKAIDALLPIGKGQRLGVFAASGVGKTTLLRQFLSNIKVDRTVICLVGERGREVEAIWSGLKNGSELEQYTCVAATSDQSAAMRVKAVQQALCLCEFWRDKGQDVLLVVDSMTRYAMALREIGLASGEPPTLRSYTANVFTELPRAVERCGASRAGGSISAIFTVLSETDDVDDPIVEVMKSLLDGHIILSRQLAEQGHFPAIDVVRSVSRHAELLVTPEQDQWIRTTIGHLARHEEAKIMIESGVYKAGINHELDKTIQLYPRLMAFLQQTSGETIHMKNAYEQLAAILKEGAT
ncbi:FliI/YscN family ATPase [Candidatus Phycosocius spiralis]|uniref:ATP synthase n=1 Tax=Candidatus Phycosocius spiralis TaxID=2815099 RepID=A0ABQ4PYG1_9PROT|nr:FliI/YscN family ATPase [Candidatus Phycosocius spiralis]GIU68053.1 ATP synthase [Candidatus Phycosocius spiralis]